MAGRVLQGASPYVHIKGRHHDTGAAQQVKLGHEVQHTLHILLMPSPCLFYLHADPQDMLELCARIQMELNRDAARNVLVKTPKTTLRLGKFW